MSWTIEELQKKVDEQEKLIKSLLAKTPCVHPDITYTECSDISCEECILDYLKGRWMK